MKILLLLFIVWLGRQALSCEEEKECHCGLIDKYEDATSFLRAEIELSSESTCKGKQVKHAQNGN